VNPAEASQDTERFNEPKVVLTPDLVGRSLFAPEPAAVLHLWRDRRIRPVLNRTLLLRYMKLLRQLGLDDRLLKRWAWWFNSNTRTTFLDDADSPATITVPELCADLARQSQAVCIIHGASIVPPPSDIHWLIAAAFQELCERSWLNQAT
jgi:hypothetical protein